MAAEHATDIPVREDALVALHTPLSEDTRLMLDELTRLDDAPISDILARAIAVYWGQRLHETSNDAYEALRSDPEAWQSYHEDRAAWEVTLLDGLADG